MDNSQTDDLPISDIDPAASPPTATVDLGLLLDPRTMITIGRGSAAMPESAEIRTGGGEPAGRWRALNMPHDGQLRFLGVLVTPNVLRAQAGGIDLQAETGSVRLPDAGRVELDYGALIEALRDEGMDVGRCFEFLRRALVTPGASPEQPVWRFLFGMLSAISRQDGFVEILGSPEGGGLLLQGWSVHLPPGALDLGILAGSFEMGRATIATFERPDLPATARGLVAHVPQLSVDPGAVQRIHFRAGEEYLHLDVVERRLVLGPEETAGHLRDVQAKLKAEPAILGALRRLCRPRFTGIDTVTTLTQPVRIAADLALHAAGAGVFVSGWLLDPRRLVRDVTLRSSAGRVIGRVDEAWVRLPRADVSQGFAQDALFAADLARPHDQRHGFMAFVPSETTIAAEETLYLELGLGDDACAFAPLRLERPEPGAVLSRLLGSVNLDDPAIEEIVSRHLGPLAAALGTARRGNDVAASPRSFGTLPWRIAVSVITALPAEFKDLDVNLAQLAGDPDLADCEMIFVAPRTGGERAAAALKRGAEFYGAAGTLVLTDRSLDRFEAMEVGARHARGDLLLFLSPSVLPRERGWLGRMRKALAGLPAPGVLSPTLLYEDESIRFAGSAEPPPQSAIASLGRFAGYSQHWLASRELAPVWAGTMDCALMPRQLFESCGGFSRVLLGPEFKNADFALSLRTQGQRAYWLPDVSLYALDEPETPDANEYWTRVRALVDRWAFSQQWSPVLAA
ncbi:MAG: hypothetical protein JNK67_08445 [Alphaproteobacteria bacterium]|nr:hypothetical protein [Alphaproteobacteria bacterium]